MVVSENDRFDHDDLGNMLNCFYFKEPKNAGPGFGGYHGGTNKSTIRPRVYRHYFPCNAVI